MKWTTHGYYHISVRKTISSVFEISRWVWRDFNLIRSNWTDDEDIWRRSENQQNTGRDQEEIEFKLDELCPTSTVPSHVSRTFSFPKSVQIFKRKPFSHLLHQHLFLLLNFHTQVLGTPPSSSSSSRRISDCKRPTKFNDPRRKIRRGRGMKQDTKMFFFFWFSEVEKVLTGRQWCIWALLHSSSIVISCCSTERVCQNLKLFVLKMYFSPVVCFSILLVRRTSETV